MYGYVCNPNRIPRFGQILISCDSHHNPISYLVNKLYHLDIIYLHSFTTQRHAIRLTFVIYARATFLLFIFSFLVIISVTTYLRISTQELTQICLPCPRSALWEIFSYLPCPVNASWEIFASLSTMFVVILVAHTFVYPVLQMTRRRYFLSGPRSLLGWCNNFQIQVFLFTLAQK